MRRPMLTLTAVLCAGVVAAPPASATASPPGIPSTSTAESQLDALPVEAEGSMTGYDREDFPHWSPVEDSCNARETVLERDGDDVRTGNDCYPTSGSWHSEYDGDEVTSASDVDIDHLVSVTVTPFTA